MRRQLSALAGWAFVATSGGAALAHHSFAMFDQENPIELSGVVKEFKFTNPHTFSSWRSRDQTAAPTVWNLEGRAPSLMASDGWTSGTLKPGDEMHYNDRAVAQRCTGRFLEYEHPQIYGRATAPDKSLE